MWLKMYIGNVFIDRHEIEFEEMDTQGERRRHLEKLARELMEENRLEVIRSGVVPLFFVQAYSMMNAEDFNPGGWERIIRKFGSEEAIKNIRWLCAKLNSNTPQPPDK